MGVRVGNSFVQDYELEISLEESGWAQVPLHCLPFLGGCTQAASYLGSWSWHPIGVTESTNLKMSCVLQLNATWSMIWFCLDDFYGSETSPLSGELKK